MTVFERRQFCSQHTERPVPSKSYTASLRFPESKIQFRFIDNHCPRKVYACDAQCCREKSMFIVDRVILLLLTQASLPRGPFRRSLRCAVCTSETQYVGVWG